MVRSFHSFFKTMRSLALALNCLSVTHICALDYECPHFSKETFAQTNAYLAQADELLDAGLYVRSILLYKEILADLAGQKKIVTEKENGLETSMRARFHLAQAYFATQSYSDALPLLEDNIRETIDLPVILKQIRRNSIYLKALIYKITEEDDKAKETFHNYLHTEDAHPPSLLNEAKFEIALINFRKGNLLESKNQLESLQLQHSHVHLQALAQLYLARIALTQGDFHAAEIELSSLEKQILPSDNLYFELSYMQGEVCFQTHRYLKAAECFEKALPNKRPEKCSWYSDTLFYQGMSYLKLADDSLKNKDDQTLYFTKAENALQHLLTSAPEEKVYLALGQCYLSRASRLKDENAYAQAEQLLSRQEVFTSREAQAHALLLRAEAAPSYAMRDKLYRQLTQDVNQNSSFFAKGWYLRALNDFEEGRTLLQADMIDEAHVAFERAAVTFKKAFELLKTHDKPMAGSALKYQALAASYRNNRETNLKAVSILEDFIQHHPDILVTLEHPDEIFYLNGFFMARLAQKENDEKFADKAEQSLKQSAAFPNSKFGDAALIHLGALQYHLASYAEAESTYLQMIKEFPNSPYLGEAWYWSACCADKLLKDSEIGKQRRSTVFEKFSQSPYAPEAFFSYYTYAEYLQGDRNAIRHLHNFTKKYPHSPFIIQAQYLIGLDYKRDRKTPEGKWIRKKSLTDAIDAFQVVENQFDDLMEKGLIPDDQLEYYIHMRYRATLERAMANLAIAEESQGAKQQIYLDYAEDVLKHLVEDLHSPQHPHIEILAQSEGYAPLYEESAFWLTQTYVKEQKEAEAEKALNQMLDYYRQGKITRGYYLSRVWYEKGQIALRLKEFELALQHFKHAEDASKGNVLGTDQKLNLWIQLSACYCGLHQYDDAILILSRVVNDDAVSGLRLEAMYLRAEIYELQERPELARKQLESLAKKGGSWALKAKEKLEKIYGH